VVKATFDGLSRLKAARLAIAPVVPSLPETGSVVAGK